MAAALGALGVMTRSMDELQLGASADVFRNGAAWFGFVMKVTVLLFSSFEEARPRVFGGGRACARAFFPLRAPRPVAGCAQGLGFRASGLGLRVYGLGFRRPVSRRGRAWLAGGVGAPRAPRPVAGCSQRSQGRAA